MCLCVCVFACAHVLLGEEKGVKIVRNRVCVRERERECVSICVYLKYEKGYSSDSVTCFGGGEKGGGGGQEPATETQRVKERST